MSKYLILFFTSFLIFPSIFAQSIIDYSAYKEIWSEDFNGTIEDVEKNWRVGEYSWGNYNDHKNFSTSPFARKHITFLSSKENMSVSNGEMHMKNTMLKDYEYQTICEGKKDQSNCEDYRVKYTFSTMETTFGEMFGEKNCDDIENDGGWMYGLFEVRCKVPSNPLMFSTFWMIPAKASVPEIDIFEFTHFCRKENLFDGCNSRDFTNGIAPKFKEHNDAIFDHAFFKVDDDSFYDEYHTWSLLWTPEKLVFYLDGNEYRTWYGSLNAYDTPLDCQWRRMKIILTAKPSNMAQWPSFYNKFDPNTEFTIDYVKVYKPKKSKYVTDNKLSLVAENINPSSFDVKEDINAINDKVVYQDKQKNIQKIAYEKELNQWQKEKAFGNINLDIKRDYIQGNEKGFYYIGKQNKLFSLVQGKDSWQKKTIENSLSVKGEFILQESDFRQKEIVYLAKNNTLNKITKTGEKWTNNLLFNDKLKTKNNFISKNNKVLFEHKNQLKIINKKGDLHSFSYNILGFKNSKKNKTFDLSADGNQVFYITENNSIRYHQYNETSKNWDENKLVNRDFDNVYDNLIVAKNGTQIFYTDQVGLMYTLSLNKNSWEKTLLDKDISIDLQKKSVFTYDEINNRLFFTSSYRNPTIFKRTTKGVIAYFEKSKLDSKWNYRKILVLDNEANRNKKQGRVLENIHIAENGTVFYVGLDKNIYAIYKPQKAHDLEYKHKTYVNGFR